MSNAFRTQWPIIGHEWAIAHLDRTIRHGRIRHAYLFTGPDSIGKTTLAYALAAALNCTGETRPCGECRACKLILKRAHSDVALVQAEQEGGTLKIDQVRGLQQTLALRPYEARYRIAILRRFHEANPAAANALLKTLEEPSPDAILILTARSTDLLLPTVISRCQPLHLRPLPIETVHEALEWHAGAPQDIAKLLAQLSGGRIGWALRASQDTAEMEQRNTALDQLQTALGGSRRDRFQLVEKGISLDKPGIFLTLEHWVSYWRDVLLVATGSRTPITNWDYRDAIRSLASKVGTDAAHKALLATRRTADYLGKNVNARLALEVLMLDYPVA